MFFAMLFCLPTLSGFLGLQASNRQWSLLETVLKERLGRCCLWPTSLQTSLYIGQKPVLKLAWRV